MPSLKAEVPDDRLLQTTHHPDSPMHMDSHHPVQWHVPTARSSRIFDSRTESSHSLHMSNQDNLGKLAHRGPLPQREASLAVLRFWRCFLAPPQHLHASVQMVQAAAHLLRNCWPWPVRYPGQLSPAFQVLHQLPVVVSMSSRVEAFAAEAYARTKQWSWYGRDPPPPVPRAGLLQGRLPRPRALEAPQEAPPLPATEPQRPWRCSGYSEAQGLQWNFLRRTNFASKPDLPNEVVQETMENESKAWGLHLHHLQLLQLHLHQLPGCDPFVHLPKLHLHWQVWNFWR
mmetsp:Transcript_72797/g.115656  ORF Transcript_72797/g.115656 Transcript_72797/m.115656 type:complete len:286 (-) Transcript_72797:452-1309(-)